jgi:hypothetical protein
LFNLDGIPVERATTILGTSPLALRAAPIRHAATNHSATHTILTAGRRSPKEARMKRREFFEKAGISSAAFVSLSGLSSVQSGGQKKEDEEHGGGHDHKPNNDPLSLAVVSFGQWKTDVVLDRFPNVSPPPPRNNHQLFPFEAKIKAGGAVSFIISGLHLITVYDDGTEPEQIDVINNLQATTGVPAGVPVINDPLNRLYRGPDPSTLGPLTLDRTETVHFARPGRFLVICGIRPHFVNDRMHGFVRVLP